MPTATKTKSAAPKSGGKGGLDHIDLDSFAADGAFKPHGDLSIEEVDLSDVGDGFFDETDFQAMGIEPGVPTEAKPGSEDKVLVLAARYAAGLPLWHGDDCYDHAPDRFAGLLAGFGAGS